MSNTTPGPIRRLLVGAWTLVDFSRRLVFNLVFLLVLAFLLVVMLSSPGVQPVRVFCCAAPAQAPFSRRIAFSRLKRACSS